MPAILEQKITGDEARRVYRALIRQYGEDAPGPAGLRLAPSAERLAGLPYYAFHPLGLERRRAELLRRIGAAADRLESLTRIPGGGRRSVSSRSPGSGRGRRVRSAGLPWVTRTR